jgi:hypothetical protein
VNFGLSQLVLRGLNRRRRAPLPRFLVRVFPRHVALAGTSSRRWR